MTKTKSLNGIFKKTELLFSKIIQQHESIPIELEITTFTSWK